MATPTGKVLCRYFMNGSCAKGPLCTFSHDWKDQPDMVCRFYLQGQCWYGDKCHNNHVRPKYKMPDKEQDDAKPKKLGSSLGPVLLPSQSAPPPPPSTTTTTNTDTLQPKLVALKRDPSKVPRQWVQASEFIPGRVSHGGEDDEESGTVSEAGAFPSYSGVAGAGLESDTEYLDVITIEEAASLMCPFAEMGSCPFGESCEYTHGDLCEMCGKECLSPFDPEQRKTHHRECVKSHEQEMERAFAIQKSEGKTCGVCMEVVLCKVSLSDRRFGILSHCDHCFCLGCIRKWRGSTHARKITIRACPLCRTVSHFVIPSQVWVDEEEEKKKLIDQYKNNLSKQHCKHFNRGKGTCPFGNSCFYNHEYEDGTKAVINPRVAVNDQGEGKFVGDHTLWEFIEERDTREDERAGLGGQVDWTSSSGESDDDPFL